MPLPSMTFESGLAKKFQDEVISYFKWQIAHDCKATGLKKLQGYIWTSGYNAGLIHGQYDFSIFMLYVTR